MNSEFMMIVFFLFSISSKFSHFVFFCSFQSFCVLYAQFHRLFAQCNSVFAHGFHSPCAHITKTLCYVVRIVITGRKIRFGVFFSVSPYADRIPNSTLMAIRINAYDYRRLYKCEHIFIHIIALKQIFIRCIKSESFGILFAFVIMRRDGNQEKKRNVEAKTKRFRYLCLYQTVKCWHL